MLLIVCLQANFESTMKIPLPLLIIIASNYSQKVSLSSLPLHHPLTQLPSHPLTHTISTCPYQDVILEAPICSKLTRVKDHISSDIPLQRSANTRLWLKNCSIMADFLPRELFLGKSESYFFRIHYTMGAINVGMWRSNSVCYIGSMFVAPSISAW